MNSDDSFRSHFKMPKAEINRIRKDYRESKALGVTEEQRKKYDEQSEVLFSFYEEISGRKSNRDVVQANLVYWFEEGYEPPEMIDYIRSQVGNNFFIQNPEKFTISTLFPITDHDRICRVWDEIQYFFSLKNKKEKRTTGLKIKYKCGHDRSVDEISKDPTCYECLSEKNLMEVIQSPNAALRLFDVHRQCGTPVDEEMEMIAKWFCRQPEIDITLYDYAERTFPMRKIICARYGIEINSDAQTKMLKQAIG